MLERGCAGPVGMDALRDLGSWLRVAEQDEFERARPDRDDVGERQLAGLVDEQHVDRAGHVRAGEQPRRAGRDVDWPAGERRPDIADLPVRSTHRATPALIVSPFGAPEDSDVVRSRAASSTLARACW